MGIETIQEVEQAVLSAEREIRRAEQNVGAMARIIAGRLQRCAVSHSTLAALKKELANYNIHTRSWKD